MFPTWMPCCCFSELYVLIYEASFESVELWIKCFCQVVIFVSKTSTANCYCRRLENPRAASRGRNKCWNWQMAAIGIYVIEWRGLLTAGSSTSVVHWTGNSIIYINILFDSKCITSTLDSSQIVLDFKSIKKFIFNKYLRVSTNIIFFGYPTYAEEDTLKFQWKIMWVWEPAHISCLYQYSCTFCNMQHIAMHYAILAKFQWISTLT